MKITFQSSHSGRNYFEDFLKDLSREDKAHILAVFEDIKKYGLNAMGCQFRPIEGKLWEIKIRTRGGGWRFFYVMLSSDHLHVLHSYKKQGQKAPKHELDVARKRLKEVLS
ncbi:MAG: type II toxin-antitoxin system RelE/ParE family toxin [Deltaproteobacteria bacterium]|nr:type II toxin-antitoxin system RelE/ParE family toxin [Deltaproteobacteria bacterium]